MNRAALSLLPPSRDLVHHLLDGPTAIEEPLGQRHVATVLVPPRDFGWSDAGTVKGTAASSGRLLRDGSTSLPIVTTEAVAIELEEMLGGGLRAPGTGIPITSNAACQRTTS